ncbi:MAG: MetQ/NlpA family ABC transporter substrate-binding protein [Oscillospiraceae bacterium]
MKKIIVGIISALLVLSLLVSCGAKKGEEKPNVTVLKVGASPTPHAQILEFVKPMLAKKGVDLQVVEFTDYVIPNTALESGDIDANYFQHQPYLTDFNENNGTHIVSVAAVHYEPFGIYSDKHKNLDNIAEGAVISVPNDGTNEARALLLLESLGLIKLDKDAGFTATKLNIAENPLGLEIVELDAAQLARSLPDVDYAVINGNYALQAGLSAATDALALENKDSDAAKTYANILCVKQGNENSEAVKALVEALKSEELRKFIDDTYKGAVVVSF